MGETDTREIVTPGTPVGETGDKPGDNTYRRGDQLFAETVGVVMKRGDRIDVVALSGPYVPREGDLVIGQVKEVSPTSWYVEFGAHTDGPLHVSEVPWDVDFGATEDYLEAGDAVLCEITDVDEFKSPFLGMEHRQCRKLDEGVTFDVDPTKVPRLIGRKGSMIKMLKRLSGCQMFVGQNGRVWVNGTHDEIAAVEQAIRLIEREAHTKGLTERVEKLLKDRLDKE